MHRRMDVLVLIGAVGLMLGGAVMLVTGTTSVVAFALITVGIAISVLVQADERRHRPVH